MGKSIPSRPTRARGLKPETKRIYKKKHKVAPHAGAWIETGEGLKICKPSWVAPHAGAWIETGNLIADPPLMVGRAPRGRVD